MKLLYLALVKKFAKPLDPINSVLKKTNNNSLFFLDFLSNQSLAFFFFTLITKKIKTTALDNYLSSLSISLKKLKKKFKKLKLNTKYKKRLNIKVKLTKKKKTNPILLKILKHFKKTKNFFFFKHFKRRTSINTIKSFLLYKKHLLNKFFTKFFSLPIQVNLINVYKISWPGYFYYLLKLRFWYKYKRFGVTFIKFFIKAILFMSYFKETHLFVYLLQKKFNELNFRQHKKFFFCARHLLRRFMWLRRRKNKIKGCYLTLKGKIGRKGSVRKKTLRFKIGMTSFSNKELRLNYKTFFIVTITGILGGEFRLFYTYAVNLNYLLFDNVFTIVLINMLLFD